MSVRAYILPPTLNTSVAAPKGKVSRECGSAAHSARTAATEFRLEGSIQAVSAIQTVCTQAARAAQCATLPTMTDVLILGAGLAGLAAARDLAAAGRRVQVLDKSRGVAGRAATKRFGSLRLDHGARFFTARQPRTQALASEGLEAGWLCEWTRQIPSWQAGQISTPEGGHPRYVGRSGMSDIGKALAEGLDVQTDTQVTNLEHTGDGWRLISADGRTFEGRTLLLNAPAPQLSVLLAGLDGGPDTSCTGRRDACAPAGPSVRCWRPTSAPTGPP